MCKKKLVTTVDALLISLGVVIIASFNLSNIRNAICVRVVLLCSQNGSNRGNRKSLKLLFICVDTGCRFNNFCAR